MTRQDQVRNNSKYKAVHNCGFVGLIDTMGDDFAICQAARVSYGAGTKSYSEDRGLLRYLMRQWHTSPFEMAEVKFHLKLPIFVMRQLVRHRTANLNEYSGRYSEMSDEFYIPEHSHLAPQSTANKQGRAGSLSTRSKNLIRNMIVGATDALYVIYRRLLGDKEVSTDFISASQDTLPEDSRFDDDYVGLSRELSRIVLPVANYTELYWKCDLHNFFHFARLRLDAHAQQEIRDVAQAMYDLMKPYFPLSCEAFEDYRQYARPLSRMDIQAVKDMLHGVFANDPTHYGMSKREFVELIDFLEVTGEQSRNLPSA